MGARELLHTLAGAGLSVSADGDRLLVRPASLLTGEMRQRLRDAKPELLVLLCAPPEVPTHGSSPTGWGWSDDEISTFQARRDRLMRWGRSEAEAEQIAERLLNRDRDGDDRRLCLECRELGQGGRCAAAARGAFPWASRELQPVQLVLQRCEGFKPVHQSSAATDATEAAR